MPMVRRHSGRRGPEGSGAITRRSVPGRGSSTPFAPGRLTTRELPPPRPPTWQRADRANTDKTAPGAMVRRFRQAGGWASHPSDRFRAPNTQASANYTRPRSRAIPKKRAAGAAASWNNHPIDQAASPKPAATQQDREHKQSDRQSDLGEPSGLLLHHNFSMCSTMNGGPEAHNVSPITVGPVTRTVSPSLAKISPAGSITRTGL